MILTGENGSTQRKTCQQCHFVHHTSHMDCPGTEPVTPPRWQAGDWPPQPWHGSTIKEQVYDITAKCTFSFIIGHAKCTLTSNFNKAEAVSITNYSPTFAFLSRTPGMQIESPRVTFWPSQSAAIPVIMSQAVRFWGKIAFDIKCVFWFPLRRWRQTNLIPSKIRRDTGITVHSPGLDAECLMRNFDYLGTRNFTKIRPVVAGLIRAGRRAGIQKRKLTTVKLQSSVLAQRYTKLRKTAFYVIGVPWRMLIKQWTSAPRTHY